MHLREFPVQEAPDARHQYLFAQRLEFVFGHPRMMVAASRTRKAGKYRKGR